jgi:hypothetical protein
MDFQGEMQLFPPIHLAAAWALGRYADSVGPAAKASVEIVEGSAQAPTERSCKQQRGLIEDDPFIALWSVLWFSQ